MSDPRIRPIPVDGEWDAGQNLAGPLTQRGRWTVKREANRFVIVYHFYFPAPQEVVLKEFRSEAEEAAKEYARVCREKQEIPQKPTESRYRK